MAFQPIVDRTTGTAYAYEALVRGAGNEGAGEVLAAVTEDNRYAFDQLCRVRAIEEAVAAGLTKIPARLSINFLPNAVYSPLACIQLTLKTAGAAGLPLDRLIFEFTENETILAPEHVANIIAAYRELGFGVAIDDFGAGYSGLDRFTRFVPDAIKLDMQLIRGIDSDPRRRAIVGAMGKLAAELDTMVIAEGIETAAEAAALSALGVRYQQGYWFARPERAALPPPQPHWREKGEAAAGARTSRRTAG